jgi:hypothetical protein
MIEAGANDSSLEARCSSPVSSIRFTPLNASVQELPSVPRISLGYELQVSSDEHQFSRLTYSHMGIY